MNFKLLFVLLTVLITSGCAHSPKQLYYWGHYQGELYAHLNGETAPAEQIQILEEDVEHAAAEGLALPPGFRAHLGILYGETGRMDKMETNLVMEKERFPESATFVDLLLRNGAAAKDKQ